MRARASLSRNAARSSSESLDSAPSRVAASLSWPSSIRASTSALWASACASGAAPLAPVEQQLAREPALERFGLRRQDRAHDPFPLLHRRLGERARRAQELRGCLAQRGRPFARRLLPLADALQQLAQFDAEHPGPSQRAPSE